jgi:hypothetical protein
LREQLFKAARQGAFKFCRFFLASSDIAFSSLTSICEKRAPTSAPETLYSFSIRPRGDKIKQKEEEKKTKKAQKSERVSRKY